MSAPDIDKTLTTARTMVAIGDDMIAALAAEGKDTAAHRLARDNRADLVAIIERFDARLQAVWDIVDSAREANKKCIPLWALRNALLDKSLSTMEVVPHDKAARHASYTEVEDS